MVQSIVQGYMEAFGIMRREEEAEMETEFVANC